MHLLKINTYGNTGQGSQNFARLPDEVCQNSSYVYTFYSSKILPSAHDKMEFHPMLLYLLLNTLLKHPFFGCHTSESVTLFIIHLCDFLLPTPAIAPTPLKPPDRHTHTSVH